MLWRCSVWKSAFVSKLALQVLCPGSIPVSPRITLVAARLPANWPVCPPERLRLETVFAGKRAPTGVGVAAEFGNTRRSLWK